MRKVYFVEEIKEGIVVDNCGTVRLPTGEEVVWFGMINPEWKGKREYIEWNGEYSIELPLDFAI